MNLPIGNTDENNEETESGTQWEFKSSTVAQVNSQLTVNFDGADSNKDGHLQIIQDDTSITHRRLIPVKDVEKLWYLLSYCTRLFPFQSMHYDGFNGLIWMTMLSAFLTGFANCYTHLFLASYSADNHLFLSKMVPIARGTDVMYIFGGFMDLIMSADIICILLYYVVGGVMYYSPWTRCYGGNKTMIYKDENITIQCFDLKDFVSRTSSMEFNEFLSEHPNYAYHMKTTANTSVYYELAPTGYLGRLLRPSNTAHGIIFSYLLFIWVVAALHHKQLFNKHVWKVMRVSQHAFNVISGFILIHLVYSNSTLENSDVEYTGSSIDGIHNFYTMPNLLQYSYIISMSAPPIVHIMASRSKTEVRPTKDASIIVASKCLYIIFKATLAIQLKIYCERTIKMLVNPSGMRVDGFIKWPIYFSQFFFGETLTIFYFTIHFVMEFITLIITLQCIIEIMICEWTYLKRVPVTVFLAVGALIFHFGATNFERSFVHVASLDVISFAESFCICCIYPLNRLIDDTHFHYGLRQKYLYVYSMVIQLIFNCARFMTVTQLNTVPYYREFYISTLIVMATGAGLTIYECVVVKKKKFWSVFCPHPTWGPPQFAIRELRKIFDSRDYVASEAPRVLSRYLLRKAQSRMYRLNLKYQDDPRLTKYKDRISYHNSV